MTMESKKNPWKRLTISDETQFLYVMSNSSLILTDLVRIFEYKFPQDILSKNEEFNPALEFSEDSDVFEEINRILESKDSKKVFKNTNLEVEDNDDEMPFTWIFECKERDGKFLYEQVTQSVLNGMSRLWEERSILLKVIKDKDLELEALYVEDDATLTRKSLKTKRFNEDSVFAAPLDNPFQLLTSELYLQFLNKSPKKKTCTHV
nr:uncharacterized protein LOC121130100 [Lepeophtheirus salmonis]